MRLLPAMVVALALAGIQVRAQDPLEPPDLSRYLRWGPLRVRPGLSVSNVGHDDNVFLASAGSDETPRGDYTARVSPKLDGVVLFGNRAFATFKQQSDYTAYQKYSGLNYFNHRGNARVTFPMGRFGVFGATALNRLRDRATSELDSRPERREIRFEGGLIVRLGWRTDVEIGRVHSDWENTDPDDPLSSIGERLDRVERGNRLRIHYRLTGVTRLTLDATAKDITFDNPDEERDSRKRQILPGVEFGEGARLTGRFQIGWARLDAKTPGRADFSGTVGEAELAYRLSSRTRAKVEAHKRVGFAVYQRNPYLLDRSVEAGVLRWLNRGFGLEASRRRGRLTFPEANAGADREDRNSRYEIGVRFRLVDNALGKRVEYSLKFARYRRDSNIDSLDQSRTAVGFGAVLGF